MKIIEEEGFGGQEIGYSEIANYIVQKSSYCYYSITILHLLVLPFQPISWLMNMILLFQLWKILLPFKSGGSYPAGLFKTWPNPKNASKI